MFDYAFPSKVEYRKCIDDGDRYGNVTYSEPTIINVYKTECLVRVETADGFEHVSKSLYLTNTKSILSKDLVDNKVVKSVREQLDILGDFVYLELEFE